MKEWIRIMNQKMVKMFGVTYKTKCKCGKFIPEQNDGFCLDCGEFFDIPNKDLSLGDSGGA